MAQRRHLQRAAHHVRARRIACFGSVYGAAENTAVMPSIAQQSGLTVDVGHVTVWGQVREMGGGADLEFRKIGGYCVPQFLAAGNYVF